MLWAIAHPPVQCQGQGPLLSLCGREKELCPELERSVVGACGRVNEFSHSSLEGAQQNQGFTRGNQVFHSYTFTIFQHIPSNRMAINKTTLPAGSFGWC